MQRDHGYRASRRPGSARFRGTELVGKPSYKIAGAGIAYVPQGRRLFPSLTTDEHLRMIRSARGVGDGRTWSVDGVYQLFPRLAGRRRISATQLSGGEQQMLAIGQALLTNPLLLIMDEPSEGLAPTVVEQVIATCRTLVDEGMAILLVEQNLGVATSGGRAAARDGCRSAWRPKRRLPHSRATPMPNGVTSASSLWPRDGRHDARRLVRRS